MSMENGSLTVGQFSFAVGIRYPCAKSNLLYADPWYSVGKYRRDSDQFPVGIFFYVL